MVAGQCSVPSVRRAVRTAALVGSLTALWLVVAGVVAPAPVAASDSGSGYLGTEACTSKCHLKQRKMYRADAHSKTDVDSGAPQNRRGCEACHGPAKAHKRAVDDDEEDLRIAKLDEVKPAALTKVCVECHTQKVSAIRFAESAHADAGLACRDCHQIHQDRPADHDLKQPAPQLCLGCHKEQANQFRGISHHPVYEGRVDCMDCHDPHAGRGAKMLKGTVEETCVSCHRDKRGPFIFEHSPNVDELEDGCLACHKPHGSPLPKLTRMAGRGLCVQCHTEIVVDGRHRRRPGSCWQAGCHVRIHGSQVSPQFFS